MQRYSRLNNLVGWLVFAIATVTYLLTLEPTASFWDCGEFIACSYKLLVPHPPGAPTFLLLGRLFSLLSFGDVTKVAVLVNALSALSSSFTVLFLFWSITMLAKKLVMHRPGMHDDRTLEPTSGQTLLILGSGVVGALALTFSDSFWFNAVEAEVYAMSSLCTAVVVWLMLKWENRADEADSDKWLILIAYVMGLSIGVHLLNLLAIPALGLIYYFRRTAQPNWVGSVITLVISSIIVGLILVGIIPGLPSIAGSIEVFFVNSIGLPFNSGVIFFLVLFIGLLWFGFRYSFRSGNRLLNTALLSLVFILIGYTSYLIIPIRSSFLPTINENTPNDVLSFVSYLKREQYGDRPLLYGPQFSAQPIDQKEGAPRYVRQGDKYVIAEHRLETIYDDADKMLLPRLYSPDPGHIQQYQKWVDVQPEAKPTMGQNLGFLFRYQMGHMYWRYFMWNFVGRDSDVQQAGVMWPTEAGKSGLPERIADSKARNNFFAIPLLLGVLGLFFHVRRDGRNALVVGLLFLFTGLAIVVYLNQPPIEPRERDYTFTGATYAFAIWIGLGVLGLADLLRAVLKADSLRGGVAVALGLLAPVLMVTQGWDDHDRSDRYNSVDSAKNLLNSLQPNAILFTNGDNDTFPLWYAQEVEGVRTDVRVAVLSYLNTDWYIDQMKRRSYKSQPLPISMENATYRQGTNDYLPFVENPSVASVNLTEFMQLVKQNSPLLQVQTQSGRPLLSFPTRKFYLPVDTTAVEKLGIIPAERRGQLVSRMEWDMGRGAIEKKNLVILDMLATNNWQRPIYFSSTVNSQDFMSLQPYFQLEGLAYRVLPLKDPNYDPRGIDEGYVVKDQMYDILMKRFAYRNLDRADIFYDENNLRFPANYRDKFYRLAQSYVDAGNLPKAKEVMDYCFKVMPDKSIPYDYYVPQFVVPLVKVGETQRANEIMDIMTNRAQQSLAYYSTSPEASLFDVEMQLSLLTLQSVYRAAEQIGDRTRATRALQLLQQYYPQG
ncbi:glycosyltransferase [Solirubrum puertoriconensis]|uniref:Glycosyltransferase n=2 Tax=Solirubrum puertoriconensis TaxID=1751427 RepID=A0A9X0HIP5_SOLP1|nr:glycosyltransferase [Solirubrum puertoriconensis]